MRYQIASRLSEHMAETPEGYLLCLDVPIARTGAQKYAPDEVPFEVDGDGPVIIERPEEEVFAELTIASFEGKPATVDHPDEDVTPVTWRELAVGHAQNVRRGAGVQSDLLLADLLITDQEAIGLVRGGLREISCGYDADYERGADGVWMQRNIRGNHIALVRRGRCGPRCMITDNNGDDMSTPKKKSILDRLVAALGSPKTRRALDEALAESGEEKPEKKSEKKPEGGEAAAADDATEERLAALEAGMEEIKISLRQLAKSEETEQAAADDEEVEAGPGGDDEPETATDGEEEKPAKIGDRAARAKARDAARTVDTDTRDRAKLLHPKLRVMDGDRRCAVQRAALRQAMGDKAMTGVVKATLRGSTLDSCDCVTLDAAFIAASEVAKIRNDKSTADGLRKATVKDFGATVTPADINKANAEAYAKRGGK
jgi:hypothetical protein